MWQWRLIRPNIQALSSSMEGVVEYLESASIHGLVYISATRRLVRLAWLCVVMTGFTLAGVLIHQSFDSWADSPVTTTIETLPITDLDFPNVTVCPPRNSFTSLNPLLVMARNSTALSEDKRKELSDVVGDVVFYENYKAKHRQFTEYRQQDYHDWYTGLTDIALPQPSYYESFTGRLTGSFSTPYFRQPFDENTFQHQFIGSLIINVPRSVREASSSSLLIEVEYDIEEIREVTKLKTRPKCHKLQCTLLPWIKLKLQVF